MSKWITDRLPTFDDADDSGDVYRPQGTAVCDIGLAVNERRKSGDEWVDETTFVDVTLWGRNAEVANEYTQKGNSVMIEGRLKFESWENEGQKRSKLKVVADRLQLLGGKPVEQKAKPAAVPAASEKYDYQDPPF